MGKEWGFARGVGCGKVGLYKKEGSVGGILMEGDEFLYGERGFGT